MNEGTGNIPFRQPVPTGGGGERRRAFRQPAANGGGEADGSALVGAASRKCRRPNGTNQLPRVVNGIKLTDGTAFSDAATRAD